MELALHMFPVLLVLIFLGMPVVFSLFGVSFIFDYIRFGDSAVFQFVSKVEDVARNYVLAAVSLLYSWVPC